MKLAIATPLYPPDLGGPATYARELYEGLLPFGFSVEVISFGRVRHLPKIVRHVAYFFHAYAAARRADVVLALDPVSVGVPAMCASRLAGTPFVLKVVGDYAWEQGRQRFGLRAGLDEFVRTTRVPLSVRILRTLQKGTARGARCVIVPSAYLRSIVSAWGVPADRVRMIHNAVHSTEMGNVPSDVAALPRPLLVSVGRLVPWKGNRELIESTVALRKKGVSCSLVIVGDGPERSTLEHLARERLGTGYAFTGALSHADALAVMRRADVFVLDSLYEGFSHVLVEARMAGLAIIASAAGGNPELIRNGDTGVLVPPENVDALTDALEALLVDGARRARLGERARRLDDSFTIERMLHETATVLKSV